MAQISHQPGLADSLLAKRVQEMALNDEEPPALYVCRDGEETGDVTSPPSLIPVIDLSIISSSAPTTQQHELQRLKSALCTWGCFQAVGHGMSTSLLDGIRKDARTFFQQPMEEKKKLSKGVAEVEGYGPDPVPEEGQPLDWSDRLFLEVYPEDNRNPKLWPQNPPSFRDFIEKYTIQMKMVTELVSKAMAKALHLDENNFLNQFGKRALLQARFNYYSCCKRPDRVLGLKPHADGSGYTIILQDDVEGLQVLKDDQWFTVPTISQALLVLMGDQMEIMTNGVFKSPVHRVVTNAQRERISIAMFYIPEPEKEIGPEEGLINTERPKLYKNVSGYAGTHWECFYLKTHKYDSH